MELEEKYLDSFFEGKVIEQEDGTAVSEVYRDGVLIERKKHNHTSLGVYYLRWCGLPKNRKEMFDKADLYLLDGTVIDLIHRD